MTYEFKVIDVTEMRREWRAPCFSTPLHVVARSVDWWRKQWPGHDVPERTLTATIPLPKLKETA